MATSKPTPCPPACSSSSKCASSVSSFHSLLTPPGPCVDRRRAFFFGAAGGKQQGSRRGRSSPKDGEWETGAGGAGGSGDVVGRVVAGRRPAGGRFGNRQHQGEGAALADLAVDQQAAAMAVDDVLHD